MVRGLLVVWVAGSGLGCGGERSGGAGEDVSRANSPATSRPVVKIHADSGLSWAADWLQGDRGIWSRFPGMGTLGPVWPDTLHVWLTHDVGTLAGVGLARSEPWVAGTANLDLQRVGLRVDSGSTRRNLRSVLRHEVAHLAVHRATGGQAPRWLSEGYAQLVAGGWDVGQAWRLRFALFRLRTSILQEGVLRFSGHGADARLDYLLSYTVVQRLMALGGAPGLAALFSELREGRSMDAALRQVYGLTSSQFEADWRRGVLDRYGWLYLLSRATLFWLVFAVLLILVGWRRVRSDRARMAAMRTAEEAEFQGPDDWDHTGDMGV